MTDSKCSSVHAALILQSCKILISALFSHALFIRHELMEYLSFFTTCTPVDVIIKFCKL